MDILNEGFGGGATDGKSVNAWCSLQGVGLVTHIYLLAHTIACAGSPHHIAKRHLAVVFRHTRIFLALVKPAPDFPRPDPTRETCKTDYPAFAPHSHAGWLIRLLDGLAVHDVTAVHFLCQPRWTLPERRITDDMFLYVTRGRLFIRVNGRKFTLGCGDCAHFRRGVPHSATTDPHDPVQIISIHYSTSVFASLTLPTWLDFPDVFHFGDDKEIATRMSAACREYALRPLGFARALEAHVMQLILHLLREYGGWLRGPLTESKRVELHRLLPALEAIRSQLAQPVTVPSLAKRCGYSESQFRRVFVRTMGILPIQYQRQIRMERACQLLRQSTLTVASIAAEVGYSETAFFANTFKKLVGVAPGHYRQSYEL